MELSYQEVYKMNKTEARLQLVQTYLATGSIAQTAQRWQTSRQVVRQWVRRFQTEGQAVSGVGRACSRLSGSTRGSFSP